MAEMPAKFITSHTKIPIARLVGNYKSNNNIGGRDSIKQSPTSMRNTNFNINEGLLSELLLNPGQ